MKTYNIKKY